MRASDVFKGSSISVATGRKASGVAHGRTLGGVRITALLLALSAATSWGIGGILLKRGLDVISPATILVFQYVLGAVAVAGWMTVSGKLDGAVAAVGDRWVALVGISVFQVAGYLFFIAAARYAGEGSIPTAAALAIAAGYPVLVAVLSGPFLDETLGWNHGLALALFIAAVILVQL